MRTLIQHFDNFEFNGRCVSPRVGDTIRLHGDDAATCHVTMIDDNPIHGEHGDCRAIFSRDCDKPQCVTPSLVLLPMPEFEYNGFKVRAIGPVQHVRGGRTQRVQVIDPPAWLIDREFTAAIDAVGVEGSC